MTDFSSVYITASSHDEAVAIARDLVERRLAACANVFDKLTSIYRWEGAIAEEPEAAIVAKTRSGLVDDLIARVREVHSYSCPCIVAWPIVGGNPDYLDWLAAETGAPPRP